VLNHYSPDSYREKLLTVYRKVSTTAVHQQIDKTALIEAFLSLEQFSLLKWGDYTEPAGD
jgi:hypothetical protein